MIIMFGFLTVTANPCVNLLVTGKLWKEEVLLALDVNNSDRENRMLPLAV